eukprot:4505853-Amphidinium_carterae.1
MDACPYILEQDVAFLLQRVGSAVSELGPQVWSSVSESSNNSSATSRNPQETYGPGQTHYTVRFLCVSLDVSHCDLLLSRC